MENASQKQKDIQEIFQHIQKIQQEQGVDSTDNDLEPVDIIKNQTGNIAGELSRPAGGLGGL